MNDPKQSLDERLREIEAACEDYDAGAIASAARVAVGLKAIFHPEGTAPSLLSRLGGTYARLASTVPKSPHPDRLYVPLVRVTLEMKNQFGVVFEATTGPTGLASAPVSHPVLGKVATFRQVQAPDWWKNEPVFLIDHSRLTRRDLALWGSRPEGPTDPAEKLPRALEELRSGLPVSLKFAGAYGIEVEAPLRDAAFAALRQTAHELLGSPEFVKLAGRGKGA
ncbi:MAG: hypothetical protein AB7I30_17665 [Isosphaeraceae bacterium]